MLLLTNKQLTEVIILKSEQDELYDGYSYR